MTDVRIVRDYPHASKKVWRALTEPELIALWAMRPEGFEPVVGNKFKLVAKPQPGWRGWVECEVLAASPPESGKPRENALLRYSWKGDDDGDTTIVTYTLTSHEGGTRVVFEHTGFRGFGGFMLAKFMLGPGWKKMLSSAVPAVLADVDDDGKLRAGSTLRPKFPNAA